MENWNKENVLIGCVKNNYIALETFMIVLLRKCLDLDARQQQSTLPHVTAEGLPLSCLDWLPQSIGLEWSFLHQSFFLIQCILIMFPSLPQFLPDSSYLPTSPPNYMFFFYLALNIETKTTFKKGKNIHTRVPGKTQKWKFKQTSKIAQVFISTSYNITGAIFQTNDFLL